MKEDREGEGEKALQKSENLAIKWHSCGGFDLLKAAIKTKMSTCGFISTWSLRLMHLPVGYALLTPVPQKGHVLGSIKCFIA